MGHSEYFKVGEDIFVESWDERITVDHIEPIGSYIKLLGKTHDSKKIVSRLLNLSTSRVFLIDEGGQYHPIGVPDPLLLSQEKVLELDNIEPGIIIESRDRLWRVDGMDKDDGIVKVSSISGVEAKHDLYAKVEEMRSASHPPPDVSVVGNPGYQRLLLQALKLDLIHGTAALIGLQRSRVIPMSYQLAPVLMALELPRARLLLADDVGLGKTVEAGLIISELIGRRLAERVLFVTPANLREQWQDIIRRFFHIDAKIISRRHLRQLERELLVGGDPWGHYPYLITSIDYAKQGHILQRILQYEWDIVVIDEAHNAAKPHQNVPGTNVVMQRWMFAKELAKNCNNLLLLTATPHNGYRDSFASLLEMLNPELVSGGIPDLRIDRDLARRYIVQRRRDDVKKWLKAQNVEDDPFPERDQDEEWVNPSSELRELIDSINAFSEHILKIIVGKRTIVQRVARWTILHFHKRALSSPYALKCSIENRIKKIDEELQIDAEPGLGLGEEEAKKNVFDIEVGELAEEEVDLRTDRVLFGSKSAYNVEKGLLLRALEKCKRITRSQDSKLFELLKNSIPKAVRRDRDRKPKIIIFTRYKDTLDYLKREIIREIDRSLSFRGIEVFSIHGGMTQSARKDEYDSFKNATRGILVTTDCMAEGIDLQYSANQIIHYELPWNPNRLEQRNGRVDRFGQPKDMVYIRTLIMKDTLEAAILEHLMKKASKIREDFGFAPPFFGDDLAVLDAIVDYRLEADIGPQRSLYEFFETRMDRERARAEQLVDSLLREDVIRRMQEDSFYGQTGIELDDVTRRMTQTEEAFGGKFAIERFVRNSLARLGGSLEETGYPSVWGMTLTDDLAERFGESQELKVTFDQRRGVTDPNLYVLDLGSSVVSGLLDNVLSLSYLPDAEQYGRTAAVGCSEVSHVSAVFHTRMRYLVNTEPKSIIEEIVPIGLETYGERVIDDDMVAVLVDSEHEAHGWREEDIVDALDYALMHPRLLPTIKEYAERNCARLVEERQRIRDRLERDGLTKGMEGFDEVTCASQDILTITIYCPTSPGGA